MMWEIVYADGKRDELEDNLYGAPPICSACRRTSASRYAAASAATDSGNEP